MSREARIVARAAFQCANGDELVVELFEDSELPDWLRNPPAWLQWPRRHWEHPQAPILFTGFVKPDYEAEAREAMGL